MARELEIFVSVANGVLKSLASVVSPFTLLALRSSKTARQKLARTWGIASLLLALGILFGGSHGSRLAWFIHVLVVGNRNDDDLRNVGHAHRADQEQGRHVQGKQ